MCDVFRNHGSSAISNLLFCVTGVSVLPSQHQASGRRVGGGRRAPELCDVRHCDQHTCRLFMELMVQEPCPSLGSSSSEGFLWLLVVDANPSGRAALWAPAHGEPTKSVLCCLLAAGKQQEHSPAAWRRPQRLGAQRGKVPEPEVQQQDREFSCREGVGTVVTSSDRCHGSDHRGMKERDDLATTQAGDTQIGAKQGRGRSGAGCVSGPAALAEGAPQGVLAAATS